MQVKHEYESGGCQDDLWYEVAYCRNDVRMLRLCFMKFFNACQATIEIMPGVGNMTIASYLILTFWRKILWVWSLIEAIFRKMFRARWRKLGWLFWTPVTTKVVYSKQAKTLSKRRFALWVVCTKYTEKKIVHEILGCCFHNCLKCTCPTAKSIGAGMQMGDLYTSTMNRLAVIRLAGYEVGYICECYGVAKRL